MSDKELIKQEIESYKESMKGLEPHSDFRRGQLTAYNQIMQFIDSLPEEPASGDLEEELHNFLIEHGPMATLERCAKHFAEWQKEKDYKMYTHVPLKDIHDAWHELKNNKPDIENSPAICFCRGANWRENQMKESLQTEYEKGLFDMREEMMKDAVDGEVVYQIGSSVIAPTDIRYKVMSDRVYIPNVKLGDKVKIIIIKEN